MFTRLVVSENRLGVNTKKRVEKCWRITRADIPPGVYGPLDSNAATTFKAQKSSKEIVKIVHVTSVVQL